MKKPKSAEILLEDRIWCLFYRMGYSRLSGPKFRIEFKNNDGSTGLKRVDVLAVDAETVIVVECRARESRGRRALYLCESRDSRAFSIGARIAAVSSQRWHVRSRS